MSPGAFHDPRGRGFRSRVAVNDVLALIDARVVPVDGEVVGLAGAHGRVLLAEIVAAVALPPFDRSAMDGYALRGEGTYGADAYTSATFRLVGDARPGRAFVGAIGSDEAVEIATGAPIPEGADTVVPVEATFREGHRVTVTEAVPVGRHIGRRGEDVAAGAVVLPPGRVLRPQDVGLLSGLGMSEVSVRRRPRVAIVVTGDELLAPGSRPEGYRFADMNAPMLAALVERDGGLASVVGPLADERDTLGEAIVAAARSADVVLVTGGSATGPEDHAPGIVAERGELLVHGVAVRPASPAGLGVVGDVPVVLLPGNPVSCLCAYDLFGGRVVRRRGGRPPGWLYRPVERALASKLVSAVGRVDYARVRLVDDRVEPLAVSGAAILSSATRADGFVVVPADLEGYPAGASVTVWLYDG